MVGVLSITTTMGIVYFFSYSYDLTIFILNIVPMIGLALSIDFALLFINRFKEEITRSTVEDAVSTTTATAGRSILFSASCVFIGLLGFNPYSELISSVMWTRRNDCCVNCCLFCNHVFTSVTFVNRQPYPFP